MRKILAHMVIGGAIVLFGPLVTTSGSANAFCLWDCDTQKVAEAGPEFLDCLRFQFSTGQYDKINANELSSDGKVESRAVPGKMLDEGQLKQEWKDHPELYEGDCYKVYDITPMLLDRVGPPDE